jgi:molecular chaperone HscC
LTEDSPTSTITREQFERWTNHILNHIELPIRRALGDAKIKREDIDELILVGGATCMPVVIQRVTELFGREPTCRLNPDEVVALGAAVQAGLFSREKSVEDLVVTDVAPFTLGIAISREIGGERRDEYFYSHQSNRTTAHCPTFSPDYSSLPLGGRNPWKQQGIPIVVSMKGH